MMGRITPQAVRKLHIYDDSAARFASNHSGVSRAQHVVDLLRVAGSLLILVPTAIQAQVDTLLIALYMLWDDSRDDSVEYDINQARMPVLPRSTSVLLRQIVVVDQDVHARG